MTIDQLRKLCLSFPGVTEHVQWEDDLLFKVGGKMFAIAPLEPAPVCLTLKADPEEFIELTERQGIIPAPYLARAKWIAIETWETLPQSELSALIRKSYDLVVANLPRKTRESLAQGKASAPRSSRKSKHRKRTRKAPSSR
jgi:predicted DNA-binding protein (MmcQ/YjbR family)